MLLEAVPGMTSREAGKRSAGLDQHRRGFVWSRAGARVLETVWIGTIIAK